MGYIIALLYIGFIYYKTKQGNQLLQVKTLEQYEQNRLDALRKASARTVFVKGYYRGV
jgi:hypothetical protein